MAGVVAVENARWSFEMVNNVVQRASQLTLSSLSGQVGAVGPRIRFTSATDTDGNNASPGTYDAGWLNDGSTEMQSDDEFRGTGYSNRQASTRASSISLPPLPGADDVRVDWINHAEL